MGVRTCLIEKWPSRHTERGLKMKIWKVHALMGTSDEYSKVQVEGLEDWFREFEERFAKDFSYIRLKFGEPKFAGTEKLKEHFYPESISEWQTEADSKLIEIMGAINHWSTEVKESENDSH
jgi:hypothetical protein